MPDAFRCATATRTQPLAMYYPRGVQHAAASVGHGSARPCPARLHVVQDNAALETCLSNTYASIYVCIRACTCTHICTYVCVYICTCSNGLSPTQPHIMRMYRYISCVCQCVRLSFGYGFNLLHVSMTRGNKAMLTPPPSPTPT